MRILLLSLLTIASVANAEISDEKCKQVESQLKEGDIVFINIDNWLYRKVAQATKGWTTHVGIALKEEGQWIVAESTIPLSKKSKFCDFIQKTDHDQYSIRRIANREFATTEIDQIKSIADKNMDRFYDFYFNYDGPRLFCSKFVYDLILQTSGVTVGEVETFGDLRRKNPDLDITFWEYWFLGDVPWEQRTITPQSMYEDSKLITVSEQL